MPTSPTLFDPTEEPLTDPRPPITSVFTGRLNADLIATIAPLYLTGSVLDVTYGKGNWWTRYKPDPFTFHDLNLDDVDFRDLPHANASFDAVTFDPPYIPQGGAKAKAGTDFRNRFGLVPRNRAELDDLIAAGFTEAARVARTWLITKATDYVNGRQFHVGHYRILKLAEELGVRCEDLIIHAAGTGPTSRTITADTQLRARRAHSYLLVFDVRPHHRKR